jgi:DNA invertase Pin-like site-specific DNA recombinase
MNHLKLTADRLLRKAIVYIRQSSPNQVLHHQESQRRQYGLVDRARELGFQQVTVIDEDLGRTGSGFSSARDSSAWWPKCAAAK